MNNNSTLNQNSSSQQQLVTPARSDYIKNFQMSKLTSINRRYSFSEIKDEKFKTNNQSNNLAFFLFVKKYEELFEKLNNRVQKLEELYEQNQKKLIINDEMQKLKEQELQSTINSIKSANQQNISKDWEKVVQAVDRTRIKTRELEDRLGQIASELPEILKISKQEITKVSDSLEKSYLDQEKIKQKNQRLEQDVFEVLNLSKDVNMQINEFMKPLWEEIAKLRAGLTFVIQIVKQKNQQESQNYIDPQELV